MTNRTASFAARLHRIEDEKTEFTDKLKGPETGLLDFERISWCWYDNSLEIYDVAPNDRLTAHGAKHIFGHGFSTVYINHTDRWETHYNKNSLIGWRRRHISSGFAISHWPEGWGDPKTGDNAHWLKSGYMIITPDPLLKPLSET